MYTVRQRNLIPILCQMSFIRKGNDTKTSYSHIHHGRIQHQDFTYHFLDEQSQSLLPSSILASCKPSVIVTLTQFLFQSMPFVISQAEK